MKKQFPLLLLLSALPVFLQAQLGLSGSYTWFKSNELATYMEENISDHQQEYFFKNSYQLGLNYWFRLKNVRIEFLPEVRYSQFQASPQSSMDTATFSWQSFSFHWNTRVYPLNFYGDCDCPTWSKQEPWLEKGLYLELSPGIHYLVQSYQSGQSLGTYADVTDWAYSIGLGAGIDIGLSDWITITPYGRITRVLDGSWTDFESYPVWDAVDQKEPLPDPYSLWIPEAGVHLGIRWKH